MTKLEPGARCYFISPKGLKLRCVVTEGLGLKVRGETIAVPVARIIHRKQTRTNLDSPVSGPRVRWIPRDKLRKLPN